MGYLMKVLGGQPYFFNGIRFTSNRGTRVILTRAEAQEVLRDLDQIGRAVFVR